jgi:hypothetical protein
LENENVLQKLKDNEAMQSSLQKFHSKMMAKTYLIEASIISLQKVSALPYFNPLYTYDKIISFI